ncbi:hypothetical protein ACVWY0_003061 [Arthrobacter sp. UYNi723]
MNAWDKRRIAAFAPGLITVAEYQHWEIIRYLATADPLYIKELEAAA